MSSFRIGVYNPLPRALAHYASELQHCLDSVDVDVLLVPSTSVEVGARRSLGGIARYFVVILRSVLDRVRVSDIDALVVIWPSFGVADLLTWRFLSLFHPVYVVIHDPVPMAGEAGSGRLTRRIIPRVGPGKRVRPLCHTKTVQTLLWDTYRLRAEVVQHPIAMVLETPSAYGEIRGGGRNIHGGVVRVLGQYKPSRSLDALRELLPLRQLGYRLEIVGRGWPTVEGWDVRSEFVPEDELETLLKTSDLLVIPYSRFYQSGVAVRALECCVPIVAPKHEHICELYGVDWPGLVDSSRGWHEAALHVLDCETEALERRGKELMRVTRTSWASILR
ncbi:hypothetical protein [Gordonia amicalis]|uniref:hypothetical protein n=1 Tax=Gordonia amicalis TaxID=89053 RepID=UPI0024B8FDE1|nr:hypothetical protein [Gordonia amicalis]MDJ0455359.1 hypothetical protein [Gordonia amicalis]MDV7078805.1 hypothetical protein [Gordonia amicalis]